VCSKGRAPSIPYWTVWRAYSASHVARVRTIASQSYIFDRQ
jgi:hypothetical protein